jgi:hypothetical protein
MAARGNGFALLTGQAVEHLGVDPASLGFVASEEAIEHLGRLTTFTVDLEARWQADNAVRRLEHGDGAVLLDVEATVAAEPAVVWAHLTSPRLRTSWEGPIVIEETLSNGRRGVGTLAQCVTGRLATLEEIVDWQPYDHVGWRIAVPGIGPVAATADLQAEGSGTRLRLRWEVAAGVPVDPAVIGRVRSDRIAAFGRLAVVAAGGAPQIEEAIPT